MRYLLLIFLAYAVFSCNKTDVQEPLVYSEATYKMTVTMNWKTPQFSVPNGAHITPIVGMIHSRDTFLWKESLLSTPGLEDVAEIGNNLKMNTEIDGILLKNKAGSKFQIPPPSITGTSDSTLKFTTTFPNISFASMIAPSPDWFMGINNVSLFQNNKWVTDLTLNIKLYDAGTEEGNVFGYNNPVTNPQQTIMLLTPASVLANNNTSIATIATVRFLRLN
jgi:hypothetical protein